MKKPQGLCSGEEGDGDSRRGEGKRNKLLVASSWFDNATQEAHILYKGRRSNLWSGILGVTRAASLTLRDLPKGKLRAMLDLDALSILYGLPLVS